MTSHTAPEAAALASPGRLRGLQSGAREIDDAAVTVQGELPAWLQGSLLLNGPALWDLPQGGYRHWFDGQAMLHRLSIGPQGLRYRSRFLQSEDYRASVAAGKPAIGAFGTDDPEGFWRRMRHFGHPNVTDNGSVVMARIGTQWVAQTESPLLTCFDPDTLATQGRFDYEDEETIQLTSAHSHTDAQGVYWNLGVEVARKCTYKLFRIRPDSRRREVVARLAVPRSGYLHAFAMTPDHAVFWETAMRARPLSFLFSGCSYIRHFRWVPAGGSRIHAVALADGSIRSWTVPPMMAFHAVQAWEEADGSLGLELCTTDDDAIFSALALDALRTGAPVAIPHKLSRYRLRDGRADAVPETVATGFELPQVHGAYWAQRRARWAWAAGFDPEDRAPMFDRTLKVDLDSGAVSAWQRDCAVHLEPLHVPKPGSSDELEGVLLVPTLADTDSGTVVGVIDPATMQPLATLHLPQVVPFGFHAAWNGN